MFWYENDVKDVELRKTLIDDPKTIFYGSSSIRLWDSLYEDFKEYKPINLGFGGSTLASCIVFFERIMKDLYPDRIIIYAGDNDLGDGRHPEEVYIFFKQLITDIQDRFGNIPIYYLSIKPSIKRFNILDQIVYTNKIISEEIENMNNVFFINVYDLLIEKGFPKRLAFQQDGIHLNQYGYNIIKKEIFNILSKEINNFI